MELERVYFWTNTIHNWKRLLTQDKYKQVIIDCWGELVDRGKITVYAFVIMPNHLHVIWELREPNGKEMPHASFNKFTSHQFLADLKVHHPQVLPYFLAQEGKRTYGFWQRDALAIHMDTPAKVLQKIDYIHNNPLQAHWNLATRPDAYKWSSARFYETNEDEFGFLTHYAERFG
ncbi:transposase [Spirosoma sordidisoli]|uniref:Transposase n=2 Tax=Spirosoma sordidisoli TaxID=2502893 RepID=A0A4Q2UJB9_9BACT|nr:transposase [Spirosoma sordidisoli]